MSLVNTSNYLRVFCGEIRSDYVAVHQKKNAILFLKYVYNLDMEA